MKENIKRDSAIDLFNSILKTARDAGALQELDRTIPRVNLRRKINGRFPIMSLIVSSLSITAVRKAFTSTPGSMVIWMNPGILSGFISVRSRHWNAILPR